MVVGNEGVHGLRVRGAPLATTDVRATSEDLIAHLGTEDHRVARLAFHHRHDDRRAFGALLISGDQARDVLRVDQWLIGERHEHRIKFSR